MTFKYKVLFYRTKPNQPQHMIVSRSEPMSQADIEHFCELEGKRYLTHYPVLEMRKTAIEVIFDCTMPYEEMLTTVADIENLRDMLEFGLTPPMQSFYDALKDAMRNIEIEHCKAGTCDHHKIDMLTPRQLTKLVRLLSDWSDDDINDLVQDLFKMCEPNSEVLILNWMHDRLGDHVPEEWIERLAGAVEQIMSETN